MIEKTFTGNYDFDAYDDALSWCFENDISSGPMCRNSPIGLLWGDVEIGKWNNLTQSEKMRLHGRMTAGDFRTGPVTVRIVEYGQGLYPMEG